MNPIVQIQSPIVEAKYLKIKAVYVDGSSFGNPGPAGYAYRIEFENEEVHEGGGRESHATSNQMEITAAISFLSVLREYKFFDYSFPVYTDSEHLQKGITSWVRKWRRNDWKTVKGTPVLNQRLWQELYMFNYDDITWNWVKGHSGIAGNERCDHLAKAFAKGDKPDLILHPLLAG